MLPYLYGNAQVLALLSEAKQQRETDPQRLVLTDWLEEHGDPARAEFIRAQCQLAAGARVQQTQDREQGLARCRGLLEFHGGVWLRPLWRCSPAMLGWRRGLLSLCLPRDVQPAVFQCLLPWVDTALFVLEDRRVLHRAAQLLFAAQLNRVYLGLMLGLRGLMLGRPV